jgi:Tfp pilus assembly protein PilX
VSNRRRARACGIRLDDERGTALVLALVVLVGLTALAVSVLAMSAVEPQIARNHADILRARYLAEAGIEHAYDLLAANVGAWNTYLAGATCAAGPLLAASSPPGGAAAYGEFRVHLRNDCRSGDERLTGVAAESDANATNDTNSKLIVTSTGASRRATHTINVIVASQTVSRPRVLPYGWTDQ